MQENRLEILVSLTAEDQKRCLLWYERKKILGLKIIIAIFATIVLLVGVGFSLDSDDSTSPIAVIPLFIPLLLFSFLLFSILRNINKQAEIVDQNSEQIKYTFTDKGFDVSSKSSTLNASWEAISNVIENKTDFLFFPQDNLFFPIPKVSFENENQIEKLRSHIKANLGLNAKLNK